MVDFGGGGGEEGGEGGAFFGGEFGEDEVSVADFLAERGIGAESEAGKLIGAEMFNNGFEAVVATGGAFFFEAESAEGESEVVADDQNVF